MNYNLVQLILLSILLNDIFLILKKNLLEKKYIYIFHIK